MRLPVAAVLCLAAACGRIDYELAERDAAAPPIDAPPTDAPPTDAPPTDAPPTDAPPTDAPPTDAPSADAAPGDAGPSEVVTTARSIGTAGVLVANAQAMHDPAMSRVLFDGFAVTPEVGLGDVVEIGGVTLYVAERESSSSVRVQRSHTSVLADDSARIRRAYTSLQAWADDTGGDLVAENRAEIGVAYPDGPFTPSTTANPLLLLAGATTDATHFRELSVAAGAEHRGAIGSGVVLDGGDTLAAIVQIDEDFARISGVAITGFGRTPAFGNAGVVIRATDVELDRVLVHTFPRGSSPDFYGIRGSNAVEPISFTVRNSLVIDGDIGILAQEMNEATIEGCTLHDLDNAVQVKDPTATATVTNTIATTARFGGYTTMGGGVLVQSNNVSGDTTASGPGAITGVSPASLYVSTTAGALDLHLVPGSPAIDTGTALGAAAATDIDGDPRPRGAGWDIGADEL